MRKRCQRCGFRSDCVDFFRREAAPGEARLQTVCLVCLPAAREPGELRTVAGAIIAGSMLLAVLAWACATNLEGGLVLGQIVLFVLLGWPLATVVHEAGHASAALLLKRRVVRMVIGRGRIWLRLRTGLLSVEVRMRLWAGGQTHYSVANGRLSKAVIILAGPAANLALAALLFTASLELGKDETRDIAAAWAFGLAVLQGLIGLINLAPFVSRNSGLPSDGLQLVRLLRPVLNPDIDLKDVPALALAYAYARLGLNAQATECAMKALAQTPGDTQAASMVIHCLSRSQGDQAAIAWWLGSGFEPGEGASELDIAFMKANIAWSALKANCGELVELTDINSAEALAAAPDRYEVLGTRGAWLATYSDAHAGASMLVEAARQTSDWRDKADFCGFLARAMERLRHLELAGSYADAATHFRNAAQFPAALGAARGPPPQYR